MLRPLATTITPHQSIGAQSPLYQLEIRRIPRGQTATDLSRWTRSLFLRVFLVIGAFWLVTIFTQPVDFSLRYNVSSSFLAFGFVLALVADGLLDFACLIAGAGGFSRDRSSGLWDLMRLTTVNDRDIIEAKHSIVRLRAWRMTSLVAGARLSIVLLTLLHTFAMPYEFRVFFDQGQSEVIWTTSAQQLIESFSFAPLITTGSLLWLATFAVIYLIEPFWRMRAMTALALNNSVRFNLTSIFLAGFGSIIALWILQGVIYAALLWMLTTAVSLGLFLFASEFFAVIVLFGVLALLTTITFGFYRAIQSYNLGNATWRAFRDAPPK